MKHFILFICLVFGWCTAGWTQTPTELTLEGRWRNLDLVGSAAYFNTYNEIWGLAINGREYAVIGSTAGTHFIDVTDASDPTEVDFVAGKATGPVVIHRDYHNYGCYLYAVCDEGQSSLQIIDVSYLPDSVSVVYDRSDELNQAHNIFIDTTQAVLYAFAASGGPAGNSAVRLYDISSPTDPVYLAEYSNFGGFQVSHVHDGWVEDGLAYLNCGYSGMAMVDFSDPLAPVTLGILEDYLFAGYNHSGWPSDDGNYYYLGDENHGYDLKVLSVADPSEIAVVTTFAAGNADSSITHNQLVACDYLYVSYYYDGLQIYDISDPANPQRAYYYDTSEFPYDNNYRGAWGVYPYLPSGKLLVSDMQEGLFVLSGVDDDCAAKTESDIECALINSTVAPSPLLDEVRLYPQPATDVVTLAFALLEGQQNVKLEVLDVHGRVCWRSVQDRPAGAQEWNVPLTGLPVAGTYLVRLTGERWAHTWRVLKQ